MPEDLASISLVAVYSAMAVYAIAFILYTLDLSRRSVAAGRAADAAVAAVAARAVGSGSTSTAVLEQPETAELPPAGSGPRYLRAAMALTWLGWLLHLAATITRGIAAERVPWANLFEFTLTATAIIVGVYLVAQFWQDLKFLGAYLTGLILLLLGLATLGFYVEVVPLQPALKSVWLIIHVFVASLGTGFFALGAGLSVVQLLRGRRDAGGLSRARFLDSTPGPVRLEEWAYRLNIIGFVFWTFTLIAGAIWANDAWGRYWGWDVKEVYTFIIWVVYAGFIHARATRGWRGTRSAWLSIIGFALVIFNFTAVNIFFKGFHSYSGL